MEQNKKKILSFVGSAICIVLLAWLIALEQPYRLSRLALLTLPALFYAITNRMMQWKNGKRRICMIVIATILFYAAQYQWEYLRISLLAISAIAVGWAYLWRKESIGRRFVSAAAFVLTAFLIPTLCIGYIPYTETAYRLIGHYAQYDYSPRGIFLIESKEGVGLRDRYGVILRPEYDYLDIMVPSKPYLLLSKNKCKGVYDMEMQQIVLETIYEQIEQVGKYTFRLYPASATAYKYLVFPRYYHKGAKVKFTNDLNNETPDQCLYPQKNQLRTEQRSEEVSRANRKRQAILCFELPDTYI